MFRKAQNASQAREVVEAFLKWCSDFFQKESLTDTALSTRFGTMTTSNPVARYLLMRYEYELAGHKGNLWSLRMKDIDLEHILPKKVNTDTASGKSWNKDFKELDREEYVDRLGNLVLIRNVKNRSLSNKSFKEKIAVYREPAVKESTCQMKALCTMVKQSGADLWTTTLVDNRQKLIAKKAPEIWKLPAL